MSEIDHPNTAALEIVTKIIPAQILEQVVFVGGSTIGLYLNDLGLSQLRVTGDIDIVIGVETKQKYFEFVGKLKDLGFYQSAEENDPPYRYRYDAQDGTLLMDVMSPEAIVLGFSNKWYSDGLKQAVTYDLPNGNQIRVFTLPYVLASKIVAYNSRGAKDPYASEDLEDIVALIDGADNLAEELSKAEPKVKEFILKNLKQMNEDSELRQAVEGHAPRGSDIFGKLGSIMKIDA